LRAEKSKNKSVLSGNEKENCNG